MPQARCPLIHSVCLLSRAREVLASAHQQRASRQCVSTQVWAWQNVRGHVRACVDMRGPRQGYSLMASEKPFQPFTPAFLGFIGLQKALCFSGFRTLGQGKAQRLTPAFSRRTIA